MSHPTKTIDQLMLRFEYYKQLGDRSFVQLQAQQLFERPSAESNSIAIIVKHLWGNMRSRWTDFLIADGEKSWRNRDTEFNDDLTTQEEMLDKWDEGWSVLFTALKGLKDSDLNNRVKIRNEDHEVLDAIHRQLAHYAYHVGQIVFVARMLAGENWQSLSIPLGESKSFNDSMMK